MGAAAAGKVELLANPSSLPASGGVVQLTAIVSDASGNRLSSTPVTFSTDAGLLAATSATTDANGEARSSLSTTSKARVTASVVGGTSSSLTATVDIPVRVGPSITISVPAASLVPGVPAIFNVAVTAGGAAVRSATIDFGDGGRQSVSPSGQSTATHIYAKSGTYIVTAEAVDTAGESATATASVSVQTVVVTVNMTVSPNPVLLNALAEFTASATTTPAGTTIERYEWTFGDGTVATTSGNATSHAVLGGRAQGGVRPRRDHDRRVGDGSTRSRGAVTASRMRSAQGGGNGGYAMAALLVTLAVMSVILGMALPVWRTVVQREKEEELIFRGRQYARAIQLFQRKYAAAYPASIDVLVEQKFLRKKYQDPMTKGGEFEVIYQGTLAQRQAALAGRGAAAPGAQGTSSGLQAGAGRGGMTGQTVTAPGSPFGSQTTGPQGGMVGVASKSKEKSIRISTGNGLQRVAIHLGARPSHAHRPRGIDWARWPARPGPTRPAARQGAWRGVEPILAASRPLTACSPQPSHP